MTYREQLQALSDTFDMVAPTLQKAIDQGVGAMVLGDYKERVMLGDMQLWRGDGFAAITEVLNYPQLRLVFVHLAAGELEPLLEADGELEQFAKIVGASGIEIVGRKGWVKVLRDRGYREAAVHLFKRVQS